MNRAIVILPAAVLLVLTAAYAVSMTNFLTGDSIWYTQDILHPGDQYFHPHHLLYNPLMRGLLIPVSGTLHGVEPKLFYLQWLNIVITALAMALFCRLSLEAGASDWQACILSLLLALSGYFYWFSSQIEVYGATTVGICLALTGMVRAEDGRGGRILTATGYTEAMLFHQTAIFLGLAILMHELTRGRAEREGLMRRLLVTLALPLALIALVYVSIGAWIGHRDPASFWRWLTMHLQMGFWGHGTLSSATLRPALRDILNSVILRGPGGHLEREIFFAAFGAGVLVSLVVWAGRGFPRARLITAISSWGVLLALFCIWWDAREAEFWGMVFVPIAFVLVLFVGRGPCDRRPMRVPRAAGSLCLTLALAPMLLSVFTYHTLNQRTNEVREAARVIAHLGRDGDVIWTANTGNSTLFRIYLEGTRATVLSIDVKPARAAAERRDAAGLTASVIGYLEGRVREVEAAGGRCLVDRWVLEGRISTSRLMKGLDVASFTRLLRDRFRIEPLGAGPEPYFVQLRPSGDTVPDTARVLSRPPLPPEIRAP